MSTDNNNCANCGKGEEESLSLKNCAACKLVKYCSRDCQKAHRPQHKKECKKRAAELHEEALFKQPPRNEECPICFVTLPSLKSGRRYNACCGKTICSGCLHAGALVGDDHLCPFCRTPAATSDVENIKRVKKRVELDDARATHEVGVYYYEGSFDFPKDMSKALELWHRAGELGNAASYHNIGNAYLHGHGVERDEKKATHYWELAAMGGDQDARDNLGNLEGRAFNVVRALKHYMISAGGGSSQSLKRIKQFYMNGLATKDDYATALQAYQAYVEDIKSDDRDKAAAFDDTFKYYQL